MAFILNDDRGVAPILSPEDTAFIASRMTDETGAAEGPIAPPLQQGEFRVPTPGGFRILSQNFIPSTLANVFVLAWTDLEELGVNKNIAGYRVYAKLALSDNEEPTLVGVSTKSPCYASVVTPTGSDEVTFFLQPYLLNGQSLPLSACPSCTGTTPDPFYQFTAGDVTVTIDENRNAGAGGTVTGVGIEDASTDLETTLSAGFILGLNADGNNAWTCNTNTGADGKGTIGVYNGDGTGRLSNVGLVILLDGDRGGTETGRITVWGDILLVNGTAADELILLPGSAATATAGAGALPAAPVAFLLINLGGTNYRVPYYNV